MFLKYTVFFEKKQKKRDITKIYNKKKCLSIDARKKDRGGYHISQLKDMQI
jgi:hypothetical protein